MASILNTGISALNAFKRQMETTGHNIANVNTEGYSRQTVQFDTREPQGASAGYIGSGVEVASVRRNYDQFLATRVRDHMSSYQEFSVYEQSARQIDNVLADASAGIDGMLQQFFAAVNDVADDPTSMAARSVMLNRANQLADRFDSLDDWLEGSRMQVNRSLEQEIGEINTLAQSLATVNGRIAELGNGTGGIPGDVLDQRDRLVDELSHYTNVSTLEQSDGSVNVFIGTGQALVVGMAQNTLAVAANAYDAGHKELVLQQTNGTAVNVTAQMTGGSLGGLLRFRDEILDDAQNALGRVALGLGSFFNAEHRTGMDLDGDLGSDFFGLAAPQALGSSNNAAGSSVVIGIDDAARLTTHEYRLDRSGGSWSMIDLDTGAAVALSGTGVPGDPLVAVPAGLGFSVVVNAAVDGDSFLLRPTRKGASGMGVMLDNGRDIAAAEAVRSSAAASNSGTGSISPGALTSLVGSPSLPTTPAVAVQYQAGNQLAITTGPPGTQFVQADGSAIGASDGFVPGQTYRIEIPTLGTFEFTMTGSPAVGDSFAIEDNAGGFGDNRNARRLADLQTASLMIGGTASISNTYGALIADVGTRTQQAGSNAGVQENLLAQAESAKSEVSGVNLDEEAADLVRFQQAYQAAAQVISIANTLFDSLLGAVRR